MENTRRDVSEIFNFPELKINFHSPVTLYPLEGKISLCGVPLLLFSHQANGTTPRPKEFFSLKILLFSNWENHDFLKFFRFYEKNYEKIIKIRNTLYLFFSKPRHFTPPENNYLLLFRRGNSAAHLWPFSNFEVQKDLIAKQKD